MNDDMMNRLHPDLVNPIKMMQNQPGGRTKLE